ncbi:MAG: helix-turn-helix transcriptional regulator [Verrucomicrobiota bacterium]
MFKFGRCAGWFFDRRLPTSQISRQLKSWRETHDLSQREAAEKLGVSRRTLQEWEQKRCAPRGFALNALLNIIGKTRV